MKEALHAFLSKSTLRGPLTELQIKNIWEKLMGKTIAQYTDNIEIYRDTLFIETKVGSLKNELLLQKQQIIDRINEALGEKLVQKVIIR